MKDLDPGRSGRDDYNPETEGKPADRDPSTQSAKGMKGSPSDRDRTKGSKASQGDRNRSGDMREPDDMSPTDPSRTRPRTTEDELDDEDSAGERGNRKSDTDEDYEDLDRDR